MAQGALPTMQVRGARWSLGSSIFLTLSPALAAVTSSDDHDLLDYLRAPPCCTFLAPPFTSCEHML